MKRSKHNLSYTHLFSCDMGELIPAGLLEVLPGDSLQMQTRMLIRCAPMLAPPMHPIRVRIHHWFVPFRLVWDNWESFITGGPAGTDASVFPTKQYTNVAVGSLADYFGVPCNQAAPALVTISALMFRAYNLIFNEWYRDQDLQTELVINRGSGNDATTSAIVQAVNWEKDYFTSARPWEQKGPAVTIPISGTVTLQGNATVREPTAGNAVRTLERGGGGLGAPLQVNESGGGAGTDLIIDLASGSGSAATSGITVNQLRNSLALQRFEENRARFGSRYVEYLRAIGVRSSDARLQRPEYLGGGRSTLQFSEVLTTAQDQPASPNPVGTLRGHGINALRSNRFRRFFEEHGYVMTLLSVVPKTIYMDGLQRHMVRRSKFDFWHKELETLGQQSITNKEVWWRSATPDGVFGYQDRYDEYRSTPSRVSAEFSQSSLNFWHFARSFATQPTLNSSFVSCVPPERAFAASAPDNLYVHCQHSIQARRLVSKRAMPRTM